MNISMESIADKVLQGQRLTREEGIFLYRSHDLLTLGELARRQKKEKSGSYVFFNVNRHINLSNVCHARCQFCAFGRDQEDPGAYLMTVEEAFQFGAEAVPFGITEFHIVSALHPDMGLDYYLEIISRLHEAFPSIHIQAFSAAEIVHFTRISGLAPEEVLKKLQAAGLASLPGGGAEILKDDLRQKICPNKASSEEWLEVHRVAHKLGMKTNCTMLYGHLESIEDRIDHLLQLRRLQDESPGFKAFIPLPFLPDNTGLEHIRRTSAVDDIKTIAISRLMLDNIDHVKAFWIMLGLPVAQISLEFGADDLDGTVIEERIMHAAGVETKKGITQDELIQWIRQAGYIPVERDTVYNILQKYES